MITHVSFASVYVTDQAKALDFYRDSLGFEVRADAPYGPGLRWIEVVPKGADTGIAILARPNEWPELPAGTPVLTLTASDVRALHDEMKAKGVAIAQPPSSEAWGTYFMLLDVEGNGIVVKEA
jgi:predicted enzyme related to lactoylglutathione lyase